jgi:antitoxin FitA
MGQVLIRNLDDSIIESLKLKAELKGHSLEQELRDILEAVAPLTPRERVALSRKIRGMQSKPAKLDSTDVIREGRDTR